MVLRIILAVVLGLVPCCLAGQPPAVVSSEFVFAKVPFAQCHASTIVETTGGTLVVAWFGGSREGQSDVSIWLSRQVAGRWLAPVKVADGIQSPTLRHPCWNPVLFQPAGGPLWLFFKVGPSPRKWWGEWMVSHDDGKTWTRRRRLPGGGIGPVKNKPIQRADGSIWCGSSTEDAKTGWQVHLEVTRDQGRTWSRIGPLNDGNRIGAIQPSLLTHSGGRLQFLCRNRDGRGDLWQCWSEDGGKTWSRLEASGLPNPNAGTDAVTLRDGRQLLVYNHTNRGGGFPNGRQMLNVAISRDGHGWSAALVLERDKGEFSYPAVIQARDGHVHMTYTWHRRRVRHVVLDVAKLKGTPIKNRRWPAAIDRLEAGN